MTLFDGRGQKQQQPPISYSETESGVKGFPLQIGCCIEGYQYVLHALLNLGKLIEQIKKQTHGSCTNCMYSIEFPSEKNQKLLLFKLVNFLPTTLSARLQNPQQT